jgi:methionine sulfoxide reductase heme-binding subunit
MTSLARPDRRTVARLLKIATHVGALIPLALLLWDYTNNQLGADPVREITLRTGKTALILLVLSLACTPANLLLGWKQALPLRRPLGLYAFLYVCLHLLTFIWLDYMLEWNLIVAGILEQRYVVVGFIAFLLLLPLALTSTRWAMRRLGKNWKRLHQLVYVAVILALIHFFWLVKNVYTQPITFAFIVALLLLARVRPIRQWLLRRQRARGRPGNQRPTSPEGDPAAPLRRSPESVE